MKSENSDTDGVSQIIAAFAMSLVTVGFVIGVFVLMARFGGYPGYGRWWLVNVVAPTYLSIVVLTTVYWSRDVIGEAAPL